MLREFVFETRAPQNPLCRFTAEDESRWILIHLFRAQARQAGERALFVIHAKSEETQRFLRQDFGRRYGTFEVLHAEGDLASVEVSNYAMPAYRGMDPVEMTIRMLGPESIFQPVLVHGGTIHVTVLAAAKRGAFDELVGRLSSVTQPSEFRLVHHGPWDPLERLIARPDPLTARQREVLAAALDAGFYESPRRAKLEDLARGFGVSKAAVHKSLQAAEAKVLRAHAPRPKADRPPGQD